MASANRQDGGGGLRPAWAFALPCLHAYVAFARQACRVGAHRWFWAFAQTASGLCVRGGSAKRSPSTRGLEAAAALMS